MITPGPKHLMRQHSVMTQSEPGPSLHEIAKGVNVKKDYDGEYDFYRGWMWVLMRHVLEGEITDLSMASRIRDKFASEMHPEALSVLQQDMDGKQGQEGTTNRPFNFPHQYSRSRSPRDSDAALPPQPVEMKKNQMPPGAPSERGVPPTRSAPSRGLY